MTIKQILTITGPTCSGKSTVESLLHGSGMYGKVISHTTRAPRVVELDGFDYYFTDVGFFESNAGDFLERVDFDGNQYGFHSSEVSRLEAAGFERIVIVMDPNGVQQIANWAFRKKIPHRPIFLHVDADVRYERFLRRWLTETDLLSTLKTAAKRLAVMQEEGQWKMLWTDRIGWEILSCTDLNPAEVIEELLTTEGIAG